MLNLSQIHIQITIQRDCVKVTEHLPVASPEPLEDQLRCKLWITCENPRCFKHGCLNALRKQGKEVHS